MSKPLRVPEEQLVAMIGRITVSWGDIHYAIFQLFVELTGIPNALAETIFFKLRSDATQREITEAAAKHVLSEELFDRVTAVFKQIGCIAGERNVVVHAMWATHYPSGHVTPNPWVQGPRLLRKQEFDKQFAELEDKLKDLFREVLRLQPDIKAHVESIRNTN